MRNRKLFVGRNIKAIRLEHALTQASFAEKLGISTSYLNQIENNQRHLTATVLLALAEKFAVDITTLSEDDSDRLLADMAEALADPLFSGEAPSVQDLKLVSQNAPAVAKAFLSMHQALRHAGEQLAELDDTLERSGALTDPAPYEEVRDFFHYLDNYVHDLDLVAEKFASHFSGHGPGHGPGYGQRNMRKFADYIEREHRVHVSMQTNDFRASDHGDKFIRTYDPSSRVLKLNQQASNSTNMFQIAHQIALLEHHKMIDKIIARADFRSEDAKAICQIGLANYFAGAATLPYGEFLSKAREFRHDLEMLADYFSASLEQVSHRLSTLQRPGEKGIPFFFARVDQAGNITKRHSATKLQFARFGSACPLWNAHRAFETPDQVLRQLAETPDGVKYLCLSTTVSKRGGGFKMPVQRHALAIGCEIQHAAEMVYADDLDTKREDAFEPIGISCRICDRVDCHQRAVPPLKRKLEIDPNMRKTIPYRF
jgi:predicted transcriptional regulator/DNA-binding XRE family transcriptional regulator